MAIKKNTSFSLTGSGKVKVGDETEKWSKGWLEGVDVWSGNAAKTFTTTITLKGHDWNMSFIRVTGDANMKVTIKDQTTGDGGEIEHIILGNAGSNVTLNNTWVDFINTHDDGVDIVTLGAAGAGRVKLGAGNDVLTLGDGFVEVIHMGDGDDQVTAGSGDAESIKLGQGNNTFVGGSGYVNAITAYDGNDHFTLGSGDVATINMGGGDNTLIGGSGDIDAIVAYDGDDVVTLGDGRVDVMHLGNGDDTVTVNDGDVNAISLSDGNNTVTLAGIGWIGAIVAYDGDDTVTITGEAEYTGSINLGGGNNVVTTGIGFVNSIITNEGDDEYNIGTGGIGQATSWGGSDTIISSGWIGAVLLGDGDDTVIFNAGGQSPSVSLRGGDDTLSVSALSDPTFYSVLNGGSGNDSISFASFTTALTLSLANSNSADTGAGIFVIINFQNLTGGSNDDTLEGNDEDNILDGQAGMDELTGGGGADTFVYADAYGDDTVTDFVIADGDTIDLSGLPGVIDFADLVASHLTQGGTGAEITNGNGDVLILTGIDKDDLTAAQFVF
jgi:Ca2+-binding RTX toxin-like protein